VFRSWNGKRAIDYRNAAGIAHDLGTAVNIQTMVFGNMGQDSATGVPCPATPPPASPTSRATTSPTPRARTWSPASGATKRMERAEEEMPESVRGVRRHRHRLEEHYREMQDMEFTIERGKLWLLQTRDGKRTAQAAVRIAVDMAEEGLITRKTAINAGHPRAGRLLPPPLSSWPRPRRPPDEGRHLATGLNVSPGAAVGQ
jgi:pyruvate, orthophosphate dikinase